MGKRIGVGNGKDRAGGGSLTGALCTGYPLVSFESS